MPSLTWLEGKLYNSFFTSLCVQHVHGTAQSGVEGAYQAPDVHRIIYIGNRYSDKCLFHGSSDALVIFGGNVPEGGGDDLVIIDDMILDIHVVEQ